MKLSPEDLVGRILTMSETAPVSILDACGKRGWGSGLLVAGFDAIVSVESFDADAERALSHLDELDRESPALFVTVSYDFGRILQGTHKLKHLRYKPGSEPFIFTAAYEAVVVHDYSSGATFIEGEPAAEAVLKDAILGTPPYERAPESDSSRTTSPEFEMSREEYVSKIGDILELIRSGETYQTNLTQKIRVNSGAIDPGSLFLTLRRDHPAAFSAFIERSQDHVISISPERFFRTGFENGRHRIEASPIKGTRPRGSDPEEDKRLRDDLASSPKDRAENVMITDLLRNDLGRVCEYGTVEVDSLCRIEELPSLFHLVSTISGDLRPDTGISSLLRALFPCGSITGCPKIRTMEIIDDLEPSARGLSMGAIGFSFGRSAMPRLDDIWNPNSQGDSPEGSRCYDLSVAIRTMVVRDRTAEFNVGGGVVIDSEPEKEYLESLDKAAAILKALGASSDSTEKPTPRPAEQSS
ncbi:MAG: anthranilate synthase component I family protein [Aridibacter famidurans]|nr:anthranilate synthase component I family protein [Aridibacter famidurans]